MKWLHRAEDAFLLGLFLAALGALTAQLASRYFLPYQFPWTEELARFLFLWLVFFGAANAMRRGGLVAVTMLADLLPDRLRDAVAILMHLFGALFLAVVAWTGLFLAIKVAKLPTIAMGISSSFEYAAVPAACALMCVRSLRAAWQVYRHGLPRDGAATLM